MIGEEALNTLASELKCWALDVERSVLFAFGTNPRWGERLLQVNLIRLRAGQFYSGACLSRFNCCRSGAFGAVLGLGGITRPPGPSGNSIRKSAPNIAMELSLHSPPCPQIISLGTRTTQQGMRALPVYSNFHFRQISFPVGGWTAPGL